MRLQLAARSENVLFRPKNLDIWGQKSIFCMGIAIFVNRAYHKYTRGYKFHIRTTPKKISVSEQWVIFQGSPLFLALLGLCRIISISTLNFGRFQLNLVETSGPSKKWDRMTTNPVRAGITEKRLFLRSAKKCVFGWKCIWTQKNTHNFWRYWYLFGKRQLFSLNNFFWSWPEHG